MRSIRNALSVMSVLALGLATLSCNTKSNPVSSGAEPDVIISIRSNSSQLGPRAFSPSPDTVAVGTKVAWRNNDFVAHTATQITGEFTWDTGSIRPGSRSVAIPMTTPGSYSYHCSIMMHTMTGVLVVQ